MISTAYHLELRPPDGQSGHQCFADVCARLAHFVLMFYKESKVPFTTLKFDGRCNRPTDGHLLVACRYGLERFGLVTLDWELVAKDNPEAAWRFHFLCVGDSQTNQVEVQCRTEMGPRFVHTSPTVTASVDGRIAHPVDLMGPILSRWPARVDGWPVPMAEHLLQAADIPAFVDSVLLNPKRALSVILLAGDGRFLYTPAILRTIQRHLLGLAHVAVLMSKEASESLTSALGPERACPVGVMRIYRPRFRRDARPADHPLFQADQFTKERGKSPLESYLREKAMPTLARRLPDGPMTWTARGAICGHFARLVKRTQELQKRLDRADGKLAAVKKDRDWLAQSSDRAESEMRATLKKLELERDQTQKTLSAVESNRERSRRKMEEASQAARAAQEDALAVRRELELCRQELEGVGAERDALLAKERQAQEALQVLRANLQALQTRSVPAAEDAADTELERAWEENTHVLVELEAARQEMVTLKEELALAKENLALITAAGAPRPLREAAPPAASSPKTIAEALRTAAHQYSDVLVVWDEAWRSAEKSLYTGPSRVLLALKAVAEVGREYFASLRTGQPLGPLEQAFRSRVPFKYAPSESRMTMAMYGNERLFQGPTERLEIQRHLTLGGGGNCVQIYFHFDDPSEKVIIAYCGQHLSYFRQR